MAFERSSAGSPRPASPRGSKIFCACSTAFGAAPNGNTCPVCTGMPGVLPVLTAGRWSSRSGRRSPPAARLQAGASSPGKNYFYPDLPKAYRSRQYELLDRPRGYIDIEVD